MKNVRDCLRERRQGERWNYLNLDPLRHTKYYTVPIHPSFLRSLVDIRGRGRGGGRGEERREEMRNERIKRHTVFKYFANLGLAAFYIENRNSKFSNFLPI